MTETIDSRTPVIAADTVIPKRQRTPERARFLSDIITTAVEGGISYWASVSDYHWWDPDLDGGTALHADGLPNAYVVVYDGELTGKHGRLVTVDDIARALAVIRQGPIRFLDEGDRAAIMANDRTNGDPAGDYEDIDANLADSIMQVAVMGEIVYG